MVKSILLFTILFFSLSCSKPDIAVKTNQNNNIKRYLALGDSYTIGENVKEEDRWPVILTGKLTEAGNKFSSPKIIATTGWTTGDLLKALEKDNLENFDLVSLLIGVNNQYRGIDFQIYNEEFRELLRKAIRFAGNDPAKVFVLSIPDYGVTPFGQSKDPQKISSEIDQYNELNKAVAAEMGVLYFDITPISRKAANDKSLLAADQLHPSGKMYHEWIDLIFPEINSKLID